MTRAYRHLSYANIYPTPTPPRGGPSAGLPADGHGGRALADRYATRLPPHDAHLPLRSGGTRHRRCGRTHHAPVPAANVHQLLPQHARYDHRLPPARGWRRRYLCHHGRHTGHVAARCLGTGQALPALCPRGRASAPHAARRSAPRLAMPAHRPLCQRLLSEPGQHELGLEQGLHEDAAGGV